MADACESPGPLKSGRPRAEGNLVMSARMMGAPGRTRRACLAACATALAAALLAPVVAFGESAVTFPDSHLDAAVRTAIGVPSGPIFPSDLATLTVLAAPNSQVAHLDGLEYCTHLARLDLHGNDIATITPIAGLFGITYLDVGANNISDISPVQGLAGLSTLYAGGNQIGTITAVGGLAGLADLDIGHNPISDVSPLAPLTGLTSLDLCDCPSINDIHALSGMTKLQWLDISECQLSDITPLAAMTDLEELYLHHDPIYSIAPLTGMTNLRDLRLDNDQIFDISPIAGMSAAAPGDVGVQNNWLDLASGGANATVLDVLAGRGYTVTSDPQNPSGTVVGTVIAAGRGALGAVKMTVYHGPSVMTASNGSYRLGIAPTGSRTLTFAKRYYLSRSVVCAVVAGASSTVNVALSPVRLTPSLTRSPSSSTLTYRRRSGVAKFALSARMADARGAVPKTGVRLQRSANGKTWTTLVTLTTDGGGRVSRIVSEKKARTMYYRWYSVLTAYDNAVPTGKQKVVVK
jgi:Leucine-rich repeat (LRR) protein